MSLFHAVDTGQAVIRHVGTGVYKQVKLFERNDELFAATSGGFIRLMSGGRTSHPKMMWEHVDAEYSAPNRISGGLRYERATAAQH